MFGQSQSDHALFQIRPMGAVAHHDAAHAQSARDELLHRIEEHAVSLGVAERITSVVRASRAAKPTIQPSRELCELTTSARNARSHRAVLATANGKAKRFSASAASGRSCFIALAKRLARCHHANAMAARAEPEQFRHDAPLLPPPAQRGFRVNDAPVLEGRGPHAENLGHHAKAAASRQRIYPEASRA